MDQAKIEALAAAESERFDMERPRSMEATSRAAKTMPRGVPMSWMDDLYDHPPCGCRMGPGPGSGTLTAMSTWICTSPT